MHFHSIAILSTLLAVTLAHPTYNSTTPYHHSVTRGHGDGKITHHYCHHNMTATHLTNDTLIPCHPNHKITDGGHGNKNHPHRQPAHTGTRVAQLNSTEHGHGNFTHHCHNTTYSHENVIQGKHCHKHSTTFVHGNVTRHCRNETGTSHCFDKYN